MISSYAPRDKLVSPAWGFRADLSLRDGNHSSQVKRLSATGSENSTKPFVAECHDTELRARCHHRVETGF